MMKPGYERLSRWVRSLAQIFEVVFWIMFGLLVYIFLSIFFLTLKTPSYCAGIAQSFVPDAALSIPGSIGITAAFFLLSICYIAMTARLWHHIRKVFETTEGLTPASIGPTPFQPENVRLLKKVAACAITMEVLNALLLLFSGIVPGSVSLTGAVSSAIVGVFTSAIGLAFGLIVFCLAHFFAYGIQLQLDSDGLV